MPLPPVPDLETPWPEHDVVWRHESQRKRREALKAQIETGAPYIAREVLVHSPFQRNYEPLAIDVLERTLERTEEEFARLRGCGFVVLPVEWFTFVDDNGNGRALARVPVVDGIDIHNKRESGLSDHERRIAHAREEMHKQYTQGAGWGERLADSYQPEQCVFGQARPPELADHTPQETICFVDPDPVFWTQLTDN